VRTGIMGKIRSELSESAITTEKLLWKEAIDAEAVCGSQNILKD
jgi:hypothetical protein